MKAILVLCTVVLFSFFSYAQQFQLEATIDGRIRAIFDIDGDGICEYIADTNKVYDGATHLLKYTFPGTYFAWDDPAKAQNPYSYFPHIDFNSDGKRDLIITNYNVQDETFIVFDVVNQATLFEFNPLEESVEYRELIDIDGDGELELLIEAATSSIYKNYVYSTGVTTSVIDDKNSTAPSNFKLMQNFPNPFNPTTTIRYSLSGPENVSIRIYDISGQLIQEINKEHNQAGAYEVVWDGKNNFGQRVSSGAYFYQIVAGNYVEAKKMIMLK